MSWGCHTTAHFVCLPHLTHLIQLISSLVETARLELGVSDKGDIQNGAGQVCEPLPYTKKGQVILKGS